MGQTNLVHGRGTDRAAEASVTHMPRTRRDLAFNTWHRYHMTNVDTHCNYLHLKEAWQSQFPPRSCLMKTTISFFSTVPELSLSNVAKTSSKASWENSSPEPRFPRVSCTNFLVSSLSRA